MALFTFPQYTSIYPLLFFAAIMRHVIIPVPNTNFLLPSRSTVPRGYRNKTASYRIRRNVYSSVMGRPGTPRGCSPNQLRHLYHTIPYPCPLPHNLYHLFHHLATPVPIQYLIPLSKLLQSLDSHPSPLLSRAFGGQAVWKPEPELLAEKSKAWGIVSVVAVVVAGIVRGVVDVVADAGAAGGAVFGAWFQG
jgi:hypothetical protein